MILNNNNLLLFAAKNYNSIYYDDDELIEDLNRITTIMRSITKWKRGEKINLRMIINNIVVMHNVFGVEAAREMLFYKMEEHWDVLKAIYDWMGLMPDQFRVGDKGIIDFVSIKGSKEIEEGLKKL